MTDLNAAHYYRRREIQERESAAAAATARLAERHLDLADGYRVLAEQVEEAALPAMRRMYPRVGG